MGSVRASPQAVLIEAVGLTQWRARPLDDAAAQRRLRVRGGRRHVVADARRRAPGGRGVRRGRHRPCGRDPRRARPRRADLQPVANVLGTGERGPCLFAATFGRVPGVWARGGVHVRPVSSATARPRSWPRSRMRGCTQLLHGGSGLSDLPARCDRARRRAPSTSRPMRGYSSTRAVVRLDGPREDGVAARRSVPP